jgi:hypothetical protein
LHWETFKYLQVLGFFTLIYGTFLFNDVISPPPLAFFQNKPSESVAEVVVDENTPLLLPGNTIE